MSESAPEPTAAPSGDGDAAAQQMLADAVARPAAPANQPEPSQPTQNGGQQQETDWEAEAAKFKALARKHENRHLSALGFKSKDEIDQLRQAAQKYAEFEDTQKTELQKAIERAEKAEKAETGLRAANARLMAAATHNLPADLIEILGEGTDEQINERARVLAEKLAANHPPAPPAPAVTRPVESLTPGAKPANEPKQSPDDWIRALAGRGG